MHFVNAILSFITCHAALAYTTIFVISLTESLAVVGLLIPGTLVIFGFGAIVATGSLKLIPVLLLAVAGAIAGDGISYWLGHHYKEKIENIWPFSRYPRMIDTGKDFFQKHGGKSVLFGRFVGPVRPVIPMVAGMLGMGMVRFSIVNILSAIGWALVHILPGVIFGASLAVAGAVSARLVVLILILSIAVWVFIRLGRRGMSLFEQKGPAWISVMKQWAKTGAPNYGSVPRFKRFLTFLFFQEQGEEWLFAFLVLVLFAAGWGFIGILEDVLAKDPLVVSDRAVYHFLQSLRTPWADHVFVAITEMADSFVNLSMAAAVLLVLLFKRCRLAAFFWVLAALGGLLGVQLLKWGFHLPRPVAIYQGTSAYGFPSGHTTMSVVLYGFLAILMVRQVSSYWRWGLFSGLMLIVFVIGFSRLYLGAHWLSDVLGGYCIGLCWTAFLGIAYLKRADADVPWRLLACTTAAVIVIAGGWQVIRRHQADLSFYTPRHEIQTIQFASWIAGGWQALPAYQIDLAGEREEPLTLQWAGKTGELTRYLLTKQWQPPLPLTLKGFLKMLSPDTPISELPVLPRLHSGQSDVVRLVHPVDDTHRWVLRLWPTNMTLSVNGTPIFEGTIETQKRRHLADLILLAMDSGAYDPPLKGLESMIKDRFIVHPVSRSNNEIQIETDDPRVDWRGKVLLMY